MRESAERELAVFSSARRLDLEARAAYLDQACAGDRALQQRVELLLLASEEAADFLQGPTPAVQQLAEAMIPAKSLPNILAATCREGVGDRIGHYKLLEQIGEGGCGIVYLADQEEPVRRRVAVKVIKLGMDTKQVIARFEAERQALALMDHPNIAKVLDAGTTDRGRPYFVMELVRGVKLTEYCDQHNLKSEQRLGLFLQVCKAIQHAHQKGVIHRDIKPSNILVTLHDGMPVPKVIDFGIAKATQGKLTDQTLFTAFEQFMGTPAYMSPEQAKVSGLDIDTRSDIYSLGVLLYELLTGETPFEARELVAAGLDEMRRTIQEKEPVRPSTRLSTMMADVLSNVAKHRQVEPARLASVIRGDLDWIVMKCLEKERARRYETANGLATDVQRYLADEPVVARPPSNVYRFQKLVRRNKIAFAAVTSVAAVLIVGVIASSWQAIRATKAEREQSRLRQQAVQAGEDAKLQERRAQQSADEARRHQRVASEQELLARRRFYAAQVNLANQAVEAGQLGRALELLETQRPTRASEDLRTFEWYHLWSICTARLRVTPRGHTEPVFSIALSRDGQTVASGSMDSTVRLSDAFTGRERLSLTLAPGNPVYAVAFSPDGKTVASGHWDGSVRLWNPATGGLRASVPITRGWVRAIAFSPDGHTLACGGDDGVLKFIDPATEAEQTSLSIGKSAILAIAFSEDGSKVGTACEGVMIWDRTPLTPLTAKIPSRAVALAFSPDGKKLAAAAWDKIQIWDAITGKLQATLTGQAPPIYAVVWRIDGQALISGASDRTVRLWQMSSNNSVGWENQIIGEHLDAVTCLAISTDGATLASGGNDGSVKLWKAAATMDQTAAVNVSDFQLKSAKTNGALVSLAFSPEGTLFGFLQHDAAEVEILSRRDFLRWPGADGRGALSRDGKLLATGDAHGTIRLWDRVRGQLLAMSQGHTSEVASLSFSSDGRILTTCSSRDPVLKAWDCHAQLNLLWETKTTSAGISALAFSPDDRTIAAMIRHYRVDFFDALTGRQELGFPVERGYTEVLALAFAPDGKSLATASESGAAKIWNIERGQPDAILKGHTARIRALDFSPDGRTIATGSEDQTVRLWDVATGQERMTLRGFKDAISGVAFSHDGKTLAAGSTAGFIRLWRANRGAEATAFAEPGPDTDATQAANANSSAWRFATHPDPSQRDGQKALRLAERAVAATERTNAIYLDTLAAANAELGSFANAVSVQQEAIALLPTKKEKEDYASRRKLYENNSPYRDRITFVREASGLVREGKNLEAERWLGEDLLRLRTEAAKIPSGGGPDVALILHHLAEALLERKALAEARPLAEEAVALHRSHPDWPSGERQHAFQVLGNVLADLGDLAALEAELRQELISVQKESALGSSEDISYLAVLQHHLAEVLLERKELSEARLLAEQAAAGYRRHPNWSSAEREHAFAVLADVLMDQEDFIALAPLLREQLEESRRRLAPEDPELAAVMAHLTIALLKQGDFSEAEPVARECLTIRESKLADDWRTFGTRSLLGGALLGQKKYAEAEPLLRSGYEGMKQRQAKMPSEARPRLEEARERLVQLYEATNRPDQAAQWRKQPADPAAK
ncbi:MAG TPA: protein kinase [Verrucomicrobiae bacterium]|nr:protein kinase [Verrucomicrobiae bacterium]